MVRSLVLFLSLFLVAGFCYAQKGTDNCVSNELKDSLVKKYITNWIDRNDYNGPLWQPHFDSLIAICPNIAEAYQLKAIPYIKYGDYAAAMPLEDKAVELDPSSFLAYRGFLKCIFTKDYEGSLIDLEKAQKLFPGRMEMDHSYFFYQGLCHMSLGKYKLAEADFKKDFAEQQRGNPKIKIHFNSLLYTGILYYAMKNYQKAKYYLLLCLDQYKMLPYANFYLARVYEKEKNKTLTERHFLLMKQGFEMKYGLNEGNVYYVNYPFLPTLNDPDPAF